MDEEERGFDGKVHRARVAVCMERKLEYRVSTCDSRWKTSNTADVSRISKSCGAAWLVRLFKFAAGSENYYVLLFESQSAVILFHAT